MNPAFPREAIEAKLNQIIEAAECEIAGERLAGNIVKEEFWKGQLSVAAQLKMWLEQESHFHPKEAK